MPLPGAVTTEDHTYYVMPKAGGGFEIRLPARGEALVTRARGKRLASRGALWRATAPKWCPTDEGWWHSLYVTLGTDPREYFAGQAWRGTVVETISGRAYDDNYGFWLRQDLFPVAEITSCRCRYAGNRCHGCGHDLDDPTVRAARDALERSLHGPDSTG
ncbi:hypothetical protein ABT095_15170 [Kitasatospora sp. NPDC002227]|uniref:hypothetical protein n=1 Tax=Kitasatospora sp. NPDC002227 TaxID=3154773 RepID=UPI00332F529F